jgi:hypothetical protein
MIFGAGSRADEITRHSEIHSGRVYKTPLVCLYLRSPVTFASLDGVLQRSCCTMACTLPLPRPSPSASLPPQPDLSPEEQSKLDSLIEYFTQPEFTLPNKLKVWKNSQTKSGAKLHKSSEDWAPLSDNEKCFLSREREQAWEFVL